MSDRVGVSTNRRFWIVLFVVAFVIRIVVTHAFVGLGAAPDASANPDQVEYEALAYELAQGRGYQFEGVVTARRPPGTSFALVPVYLCFGRNWALGRLWINLLSAVTCVASGMFAAKAFGDLAGRWAGVALTIYPGHFYYSMHFFSEPLFGWWILGYCLAVTWALSSPSQAKRWSILAGVCSGMAILTRPQALFLLPAGLCFLLLAPRSRRRSAWISASVQLLIAACVVGPWILRNQSALGKPTIATVGGYTFWGANNEVIDGDSARRGRWMPVDSLVDASRLLDGDEVQRESAAWAYGLAFWREHPARVPGLLLFKILRLLSPFPETPNRVVWFTFAIAWILAAPLVIGGVWLASRRNRNALVALGIPLVSILMATLVFYGSARIRDTGCVALMVFVGLSLAELHRYAGRSLGGSREGIRVSADAGALPESGHHV